MPKKQGNDSEKQVAVPFSLSKEESAINSETISPEVTTLKQTDSLANNVTNLKGISNLTSIDHTLTKQQILDSLQIKEEFEEKIEVPDNDVLEYSNKSKNQELVTVTQNQKNTNNTNNLNLSRKMKLKEADVKDQFRKFAHCFDLVYPSCSEFLTKAEDNFCKLDPLKQAPANKQRRNLWIFKCYQMSTEINLTLNKEETNAYPTTTNFIWKFQPNDPNINDLKNESLFPSFIQHIIKIFDKFFYESPVQKEMFKPKDNQVNQRIEKCIEILIQTNSINETMVVVTVYNDNYFVRDAFARYIYSVPENYWNVKSIYYKTVIPINDWENDCKTILLYGKKNLEENIGGIKIKLSPKIKFSSNWNGVTILTETINDYLIPSFNTTLLNIGCKDGLMSFILALSYKKVIGLDVLTQVKKAQKLCHYNNVRNVVFVKDEMRSIEMLFIDKLKNHHKVSAIVNNHADCGKSTFVMKNLRQLPSLNHLILLTPFTKECFPSIIELLRPAYSDIESPFVPIRACIAQLMPDENHFEIVILMERKEMLDQKPTIKQELIQEKIPESSNVDTDSTFSSFSNDEDDDDDDDDENENEDEEMFMSSEKDKSTALLKEMLLYSPQYFKYEKRKHESSFTKNTNASKRIKSNNDIGIKKSQCVEINLKSEGIQYATKLRKILYDAVNHLNNSRIIDPPVFEGVKNMLQSALELQDALK